MNEDRLILFILEIGLIFSIIAIIWLLSIPIWSDSKKVCKYWENQGNQMVCIQETTIFCLERECSNE